MCFLFVFPTNNKTSSSSFSPKTPVQLMKNMFDVPLVFKGNLSLRELQQVEEKGRVVLGGNVRFMFDLIILYKYLMMIFLSKGTGVGGFQVHLYSSVQTTIVPSQTHGAEVSSKKLASALHCVMVCRENLPFCSW